MKPQKSINCTVKVPWVSLTLMTQTHHVVWPQTDLKTEESICLIVALDRPTTYQSKATCDTLVPTILVVHGNAPEVPRALLCTGMNVFLTLNLWILGHEKQSPSQGGACGIRSSSKKVAHYLYQILLMVERVCYTGVLCRNQTHNEMYASQCGSK